MSEVKLPSQMTDADLKQLKRELVVRITVFALVKLAIFYLIRSAAKAAVETTED